MTTLRPTGAFSGTPAAVSEGGEKSGPRRLEFLDGLRAIAALAVLFEHGGYRFVRGFAEMTHTFFSFGKFGLTCFFLVSGFVIPLSLEGRPGLRRFWTLRLFRLYPLYWFSLFAALALYGLGVKEALEPEFTPHLVRNAIVNLTMIEGVLKTPYAIGLYYTLTIEMIFYIVCSALSWMGLLRRSYAICWMALIAAAGVGLGAPLALHHRVEMAGLFYVVCLAGGTVLYRFSRGEISRRALTALGLGIAIFVSAGTWLNYVAMKKADPFEHYTFVAVVLPWAAAWMLFLFLLTRPPHQIFPSGLLWVGKISYSLYLLHPLVLAFFGVQEGDLVAFGLYVTLALLAASCTYLLIEWPAMRMGRRLQEKLEPAKILSAVAS